MKTVLLRDIINRPGTHFIFHEDVENKGITKYLVVKNNHNNEIMNTVSGCSMIISRPSFLEKKISVTSGY